MSFDAPVAAARRALEEAGLLREDAGLLCAVSGGSDSVALLHALCRLRAEAGFRLEACHVQHGLRGEASLEDERFVRALCASLNVSLHVEDAGLTGGMDAPGVEARARESRRAIFARLMDALGMDAVLAAHHRDDQAETVLMRLLRGAGADGLCGMRSCVPFGRGVMLRPFLGIGKGELARALAAEGLSHREDESNQSPVTPRNALRLEVIPAMERLFPGAPARIAEAAETLDADARCLDALAERLYEAALAGLPPLSALRRGVLAQAPEALARRALRRWFREGAALLSPPPDERALGHGDTLALTALARGAAGGARNLPCGLKAVAGRDYLYLLTQEGGPLRPETAVCLPVTAGERAYALGFVRLRQIPAGPDAPAPAHAGEAVLSPAVLALGPVLRRPRPGDRIRPMGAPGAKPLRRFLTDRRVDLPLRPWLAVLAVENEVLWIPHLCASERLRLTAVPGGSVRLLAAPPDPFR
ncbi:MAG TPA: tRNA lysidine(34) synthetase TilS [Candidatus Limiplasma pullicola]|nr:tRNA lysidine(34) synthetase TilS [Candidatus Limiplasma pullicola]